MSTFTQILYHFVFSTKHRHPTLTKEGRSQLYGYISGLLQNKKCHPYRIGGLEDHLHIVTHVHPTIAVADLMKDIKLATTHHIKQTRLFQKFGGWQDGYGAFTYAIGAKENLVRYVMNQEGYHRTIGYIEEFKSLLVEHQIDVDEKFLL